MKDKGPRSSTSASDNLRQQVRSASTAPATAVRSCGCSTACSATSRTVVVSNERSAAPGRTNLIRSSKAALRRKARRRQELSGAAPGSQGALPAWHRSHRRIPRRLGALFRTVSKKRLRTRHTLRVVATSSCAPAADRVLNSRKRPCLQYQIKRCDALACSRSPPSGMGSRCATWRCSSTARTTSWSKGCARAC